MPFRVEFSELARRDTTKIFDWIAKRSPQGAVTWLAAEQAAVERLSTDALRYPVDARAARMRLKFRLIRFRTSAGQNYQLVYVVDERLSVVRILRVRGPGQRPVRRRDLP